MKNKLLKTCKTCKIYIASQKTCQLMPNLAGRINEDDFCSQHKDELEQCEICHSALLYPIIRLDENAQIHILCGNCINMT